MDQNKGKQTAQDKKGIQEFEDTFKLRTAIINKDRCKPNKCAQECKKCCPVNKQGSLCIEVTPKSPICILSETLCVGCGICVKKCPFLAIKIINLPKDLSKDLVHRYGQNTFKLHRLPTPRAGQVLGLVGTNGIGKSTALQILAGKYKPNLGNYKSPPDDKTILQYFRGSELQNYLDNLYRDNLKATIKPQFVDAIPKVVKGSVKDIIQKKDQRNKGNDYVVQLDLEKLYERDISQLSGGELQRFAIMIAAMQDTKIYMFDEPSSYLDVKQRLVAAKVIRELVGESNYIICVEHDLSILDYLSDFICCLYGEASAYGIVTVPFSVREGINVFLAGFIPTENMRFREYELNFKISEQIDVIVDKNQANYKYEELNKTMGTFSLNVKPGSFTTSQIIVLLGENGTGKTTFIQMLAGKDKEPHPEIPELNVSYKPQMIKPKFEGTVRELLNDRLKRAWEHPQFASDVTKPLSLDDIIDNNVQELSGGELQRVAIILALGKPAEVYLIDEPSAYLDAEQRVTAARVIKRFILNTKKTAFVVEHDFIMATYLADQVIVYEGTPGQQCVANSPQTLVPGMNKFLSLLEISFRRDPTNFRPRINKLNSILDKEQKLSGDYFCLDE